MLARSDLIIHRATGLGILIAAIAEKMLFGTLFLSYLLTLISLSAVLAKEDSILNSLPRAFLFISFYYEVLLIVGVHIPIFKDQNTGNLLVLIPMILCGSLAYFKISHLSGFRSYSLALFTGPTVFVSFVVFAYMKFEGVLTWAMSGDSRNHVYQIRAVIDRGGIDLFNGYPAMANGFAALTGGWQFGSDSVGGGHLGSEIHILGVTSALILVICSVISGLFLRTQPEKREPKIAVLVAAISLTPFSQFFLDTYFNEGFFPISFSLAVTLAVVFELTRDDSTFVSRITSCIMGSSLILLTFPLLLPLLLPCFFFAFLLHFYSTTVDNSWPEQIQKNASILILLSIPVLIVELVTRIPIISKYLYENLNNYGRISSTEEWGLWILTLTAGLTILIATRSTKLISSLTFVIGVMSIQFSLTLDRILTANYYLDKFVWISTFTMIILNLIIAANLLLSMSSSLKRLTIRFITLGMIALTSFPSVQDFPLKPNLFVLATSPKYPSAVDARLITSINRIAPQSVFWQVSSDHEAAQVTAIWMTMGFDFHVSYDAFAWGYKSDVLSLTSVCSFATANQPATIWVVSVEAQKLVNTACASDGVKTVVISSEQ